MREKKVLFIQHAPADRPGLLAEALNELSIPLVTVRPDLGDRLPRSLDAYAGVVFGGGPQGAYEQEKFPYLADECGLIREAAHVGKPALGLCLGAQLMAKALGADVRPGQEREIGFFDVTLDPITQYDPVWRGLPESFVTTHWHGDTFDIPPGGMRLGSSRQTPNQLFRYGHSLYGLQFHLEMTPQVLAGLVDESRDYLIEAGVDPDVLRQQGEACLPALRETASTVFTRWAELL